ncbi:MAG: hypothetical protein ACKOYM_00290 [Actinomycetes bacterium]
MVTAAPEGLGPVRGPDTALPGSQHVAPLFFGLIALVALIAVAVTAVRWRRRLRKGVVARPVGLIVSGVIAAISLALLGVALPPKFFVPEFPALPRLFPEQAFFYRPITDLPVAAASDRWIASQRGASLSPAFSGEVVMGSVNGVPFNPVDASTERHQINFTQFPATSPREPVPIADPAYIETMPAYTYDQHYVGIDVAAGQMWELIAVRKWWSRWEADAGALWDLDSLDFAKGSTIASGMPLFPMVITYEEVAAGAVRHAALLGGPVSRSFDPIWPARSTDGQVAAPDALPQGGWLRLRADVDLSRLGPQARVIARGRQQYGMVMSDTGPIWGVRGTPDGRWDNDDLRTLRGLTANDFEVVDASGIAVAAGSMEARPPAG